MRGLGQEEADMAGLRAAGGGWSGRPGGHVEGSRAGSAWGDREECWVKQACIGSGPARRKGWELKGAVLEGFRETLRGIATAETPPRGSCHVSTARYLPLGVGDSLPRAAVGFLDPETRLAVSGWREVAPEGSRVLEPGPPKAGTCPGATDPARLFAGEEGNGVRGPAPLTRENPRLQKLDALAGGSSRSGWIRGVPPHLALLKSPVPVPGRGLLGHEKPTSQRRGNPASRGLEPALWRREAGPRLLTRPPRLGFPQPWESLSGKILVSRNGLDSPLVTREGKVQSYKLLAGRAGFSLGFSARRREPRRLWNKVELEELPR